MFTILSTFVPSLYRLAFYVFGMIGGLLALAWFILVARRLFQLTAFNLSATKTFPAGVDTAVEPAQRNPDNLILVRPRFIDFGMDQRSRALNVSPWPGSPDLKPFKNQLTR